MWRVFEKKNSKINYDVNEKVIKNKLKLLFLKWFFHYGFKMNWNPVLDKKLQLEKKTL